MHNSSPLQIFLLAKISILQSTYSWPLTSAFGSQEWFILAVRVNIPPILTAHCTVGVHTHTITYIGLENKQTTFMRSLEYTYTTCSKANAFHLFFSFLCTQPLTFSSTIRSISLDSVPSPDPKTLANSDTTCFCLLEPLPPVFRIMA